ncbi:MAG: glycosyltransferase family 4 protein [Methylococcales bacterium]
MRILVFADVPPHVVGGAEMQAWRLARAWVRMGHEVQIAGHRIPAIEQDGIRLIHLPVFYPGGRALRGLTYFLSLSVFLLIHKKNYDFIYCRFLGEAALSVAVLKRLGLVRLPMMAVPAAGGSEDKADLALLRSLPGNKRILELINQQCDCINFIAPGIEKSMSSVGLRPKLTACIPNGVSVPDQSAIGPEDHVEKLLFVGRLVYQKGVDILFQALSRMKKGGGKFALRLIGDGSDRKSLERLAIELDLLDRITFMGERREDAIRDEMLKAHLFVLSSRYEGMSNAALEALSYGLPCVLTACGGLDTHITSNTGWVCEPGDAKMLYQALLEASSLTSENWKMMSKKCRSLIKENFSLESVALKNMELFEALR